MCEGSVNQTSYHSASINSNCPPSDISESLLTLVQKAELSTKESDFVSQIKECASCWLHMNVELSVSDIKELKHSETGDKFILIC